MTYPARRFAGGAIWNDAVVVLERRGLAECAERRFAGTQDERRQEIYEVVPAADMDAVRAFLAAYPNRAIESLDELWRAIPEELRHG